MAQVASNPLGFHEISKACKEKKPRPPAVLCDPKDDVVNGLMRAMLKLG